METKKPNVLKGLGILIAICALGMIIMKFLAKGDMDSFIMPFILLLFGGMIYFQMPKNEAKKIDTSSAKGKMLLSLVFLALVSGIVVFFITLL